MNPYRFDLASARQNDLLREAAQQRLAGEARFSGRAGSIEPRPPVTAASRPRVARVLARLVPGRQTA